MHESQRSDDLASCQTASVSRRLNRLNVECFSFIEILGRWALNM